MGKEVWEWIANHIGGIIVALSIFIQITPIKLNPWSSLFKWIGKQFTADTRHDIKEIKELVADQQKSIDDNEKDRIRWEVLDFANSCRNGRRHTKDEYEHIIALNDKYDKLLTKNDEKNGVFEMEYRYILKLYAERQEKNDFL